MPEKTRQSPFRCEYIKGQHNYTSGCGMRALGYNRFWKVCPYCGQWIHVLNKSSDDPYIEELEIPVPVSFDIKDIILSMDSMLADDPRKRNKRCKYGWVYDRINEWCNQLKYLSKGR